MVLSYPWSHAAPGRGMSVCWIVFSGDEGVGVTIESRPGPGGRASAGYGLQQASMLLVSLRAMFSLVSHYSG